MGHPPVRRTLRGCRRHLPPIHLQSCTVASTLPGLAVVDATTTPDSISLLRESIITHQTPNLQGAMPSRSVIINVYDEAPLHQRRHPLVPRARVHLQERRPQGRNDAIAPSSSDLSI